MKKRKVTPLTIAGLVVVAPLLWACTVLGESAPTPTPTVEPTPTPRLPTSASFEHLERPSVGGILAFVDAPAQQEVTGGEFETAIRVRGVVDLGAFEVRVRTTAGLTPTYATAGELLGSTGREVYCSEPDYGKDSVFLQCVTLGVQPRGASGEGELAKVTFKADERATYDIEIAHIAMTNRDGSDLFIAHVAPGRARVE